ncbi:MAG: HAD family hydrolase [Anaerosomatales bacterium]|nr:HAD family hydrolase [Anaerosomatales bacterium]
MIEIDVPGRGRIAVEHLVLDVNGTIAAGGELIDGVAQRLAQLRDRIAVVAVTADTHGTAAVLREQAGIEVKVIGRGGEGAQKLELVQALGAQSVVAVGNGANDVEMLQAAALGVCVVGREGAATAALLASDVVVTDVADALDLLLEPRRVVATLRR